MKDQFHGFRKFAFQLAFFIRKSGYLYFQHHLESKSQKKKPELYRSKIRILRVLSAAQAKSNAYIIVWCKERSVSILGLASVLMLRPISPELVLFLDFWVSNIPRYFCFCLFIMNSKHTIAKFHANPAIHTKLCISLSCAQFTTLHFCAKFTNLCAQVLVNWVRDLILVNCASNLVNCAQEFLNCSLEI